MQPTIFTASGVAKAESGELIKVDITSPGSGSSTVTVYDNPSAPSGRMLFKGDGASEVSYDLSEDGVGLPATAGIYVQLTGTTQPTVEVIWK